MAQHGDRAAAHEAASERVERCRQAMALLREQRVSQGDNVKPLCELRPNGATLWQWVHLAEVAHAQLLAKRAQGDEEALVLGIVAPAGGGKSTLVQVLKLLLRSLLGVSAVEELSLDDFLSSQAERAEQGIRTRWDLNATNEDYAQSVVGALKRSHGAGPGGEVRVPCFSKGLDERTQQQRVVRGAVDVVLFEGWRVGVAHANFFCFNTLVDCLLYMSVDEAILRHKYEKAKRDIERCGFDMYVKFGGYDNVFERHYKRMYYEWIEPVRHSADLVVHKDGAHQIRGRRRRVRALGDAKRSAMTLEELDAVVMGAGQGGPLRRLLPAAGRPALRRLREGLPLRRDVRTARWRLVPPVTENSLCNLPNFGCERVGQDPRGFMPKDVICEYLHAFYEHNGLDVRFNEYVTAVTRGQGGRAVVARARAPGAGCARARSCAPSAASTRPSCPSGRAACRPAWRRYTRPSTRTRAVARRRSASVIGTAQAGTQIAAELAERQSACTRALAPPAMYRFRVRGRDFTLVARKTGLYDTCIEELPEHKQREKRFGPNQYSSAPARDVRLRSLCHERGMTLLGRAKGLGDDNDTVLLDGPGLPVNMGRIEGNVDRTRLARAQSSCNSTPTTPSCRTWSPSSRARGAHPRVRTLAARLAVALGGGRDLGRLRDGLRLASTRSSICPTSTTAAATPCSARRGHRPTPASSSSASTGCTPGSPPSFTAAPPTHSTSARSPGRAAAPSPRRRHRAACRCHRRRAAPEAGVGCRGRGGAAAARGLAALLRGGDGGHGGAARGQLSSADAASSSEWRSHFDHVRDGDAVLLREAACSSRRPLSYGRFRAFVEGSCRCTSLASDRATASASSFRTAPRRPCLAVHVALLHVRAAQRAAHRQGV